MRLNNERIRKHPALPSARGGRASGSASSFAYVAASRKAGSSGWFDRNRSPLS
jgi:hypothetical protein